MYKKTAVSPVKCQKHPKTEMKKGIAMQSTLVGRTTLSYGGSGKIVPVWKCPVCGFSIKK